MNWEKTFKSQDYGRPIYKHMDLPVYITDEFDFYRCVEFNTSFYGKTASTLFKENLRTCSGRYSKLFPNQKLSYWADSSTTARAEIKKHGAGNNILTFWAYDDATSTFPTLPDQEPLIIIDGRKCGVQELIDKADSGIPLSKDEQRYMKELLTQEPDCIVYDSHAQQSGENYIFFEKGFRKLALREVRLRFGKGSGGSHNQIVCANSSDYIPLIEHYGEYFEPKARTKMDKAYLKTDEYLTRKQIYDESLLKMREAMK